MQHLQFVKNSLERELKVDSYAIEYTTKAMIMHKNVGCLQ